MKRREINFLTGISISGLQLGYNTVFWFHTKTLLLITFLSSGSAATIIKQMKHKNRQFPGLRCGRAQEKLVGGNEVVVAVGNHFLETCTVIR